MPTYDVFLSHEGSDKPIVEALARKLRDVEGLRVFFDRWELVPGTHWQEALEKALAESRTCAVFLGPEGLGPWHTEEMRAALGQRVAEEPKRVIPVLLPGAREQDIPHFLAHRAWVDFRAGLDDESAFRNLVAEICGVAPVGDSLPGSDSAEESLGRNVRKLPWWRRLRSPYVEAVLGILGIVLVIIAWLIPNPNHGLPPDPPDLGFAAPTTELLIKALDQNGRVLAGIRFAFGGVESPATTDAGVTELAVLELEAGEAVKLDLPRSLSEEWFLIDSTVHAPAGLKAGPAEVVLMRRAEFRDLASATRDSVGQASRSGEENSDEQKQRTLADYAAQHGLSAEQLAQAIESFGKTEDPMDRGIAAFLAGEYASAEVELLKAVGQYLFSVS